MKEKRRYTRMDLTESRHCVLCKAAAAYSAKMIIHKETCVFADAAVTSIVVIKTRARIMLRRGFFRWLWTSPGGCKYHIEKLPGPRWTMTDIAGNTIVERHCLGDIRLYLTLNQGVL